jgi:DNA-binding NarL/FixJ family response regulator
MYNTIRVLLADEISLVGVGIRTTLTVEKDLILVGQANDSYKIQELNRQLHPDVLIIDLDLPKFNSPDSIAFLHKSCPKLKVLALASHEQVNLSILKASGIAGCVFKSEDPQTLVSAIRAVTKGNTWYERSIVEEIRQHEVSGSNPEGKATLTRRERQILLMIVQGLDNARIATELRLGHQTVRNYISQIYAKLAVNSRSEAVIWAMKHNTILNLN